MRSQEQAFWLALAAVTTWQIWCDALITTFQAPGSSLFLTTFSKNALLNVQQHPFSSVCGLTFLLVPRLFDLIFGALPLQYLRYWVRGIPLRVSSGEVGDEAAAKKLEKLGKELNYIGLLSLLAERSEDLAERLYRRAGVYMLIGALIAFFGVIFFYLDSSSHFILSSSEPSPMAAIASGTTATASPNVEGGMEGFLAKLLPRIGVLFFIEIVAFFFLRQYRIAMDEYRYFEAVKRRREENLVAAMILSSRLPVDPFKLIKSFTPYSEIPTLAKGHTTELLESRKLTKDETALFEKIIELFGKSKAEKTESKKKNIQ